MLYNFKYLKKFGQNFLFDKNILKNIVIDSKINNSSIVLEIGAGLGTLTEEIANIAKKVISFEIDLRFQSHLEDLLKKYNNISFIFQNYLKNNIKLDYENIHVISNFPYNVATSIINKLFDEKVISITAMLQREVAERIVAKKDNKAYGILSLITQCYGDAKITSYIDKSYFVPKPNVDSAVVFIERNIRYEYKKIKKLVESSFCMRRKTLINNLLNKYNYSKKDLIQILNNSGISLNARAENLSLNDFITLNDNLK